MVIILYGIVIVWSGYYIVPYSYCMEWLLYCMVIARCGYCKVWLLKVWLLYGSVSQGIVWEQLYHGYLVLGYMVTLESRLLYLTIPRVDFHQREQPTFPQKVVKQAIRLFQVIHSRVGWKVG